MYTWRVYVKHDLNDLQSALKTSPIRWGESVNRQIAEHSMLQISHETLEPNKK